MLGWIFENGEWIKMKHCAQIASWKLGKNNFSECYLTIDCLITKRSSDCSAFVPFRKEVVIVIQANLACSSSKLFMIWVCSGSNLMLDVWL